MLTEKEKMLSGLAHDPYDPELKRLRIENKERLFDYNTQIRPSETEKRAALLKKILGKAGEDPHINPPFYCDYGCNIEVGDRFFANYHCTILDNGGVKIGDDVMFAPNVSLYTVGHPLHPELRRQGVEQALPIRIGDNVWLGGNVIVLPGVTIGDNVVVAAGSIVTKDIPPNSLAMGVPCKVVRPITEQDREQYYRDFCSDIL
ncbi:sugar O-acetyltransferase [Conservatibacter flavescens]|uniref:Acetyltransferase n=1 Tax=Conservatibacter flavescens TaxID=28161 RepID=A0A2M8S1F0_9PAST|nr:sugar O-acetyltransferase [Conservatibacter flavescens]PJG84973.1 galactoside O-acetyltransferase [Conservatibacter flavescens]